MSSQKIDFVLPWVDPSDVEWQKKKKIFSGNDRKYDTLSNSESRYRDMETLKFVLRAIEKNCPWYNKIFLLTEGHVPKWLSFESPKLKIVKHSDFFFNKEHLPTFNSSSIEMNLANIRGLSDKFIYMNDDTLIFKKTDIERFFVGDLPVDFLVNSFIPRTGLIFSILGYESWYKTVLNSLKLIRDRYDITELSKDHIFNDSYTFKDKIANFIMRFVYRKPNWLIHWHHPQPYTKNNIKNVKENYFEAMMLSSSYKFRHKKNLAPYIYRYNHLLSGKFYPRKYDDDYKKTSFSSVQDVQDMMDQVYDANIRFICINDSPLLSQEEFYKVKEKVYGFLVSNFPDKASFEL